MRHFEQIYGIDLSGAQDTGSRIWIAEGIPDGGRLMVSECYRAKDLPNSGNGIKDCLPALVEFIKSSRKGVFGFDFPFSLPSPLIKEKTWKEFVLAFPKRYKTPEAFREACRESNGGREMKRRTDVESRTPFSPYNLRLFRQTYYGISKVLFPLVHAGSACVLPFDKPVAGKPWILEVCPASTLKHLMEKGVPSYKGPAKSKRENRRQILTVVKGKGVTFGKDAALEDKIIANKGGDALDSVIAALAAFKTIQNVDALIPEDNGNWKTEGYVYA
jgi:hypothetical protein